MKTTFFRLLNLLALISLFAFGNQGRAKAHDFPFGQPLDKTCVSNCIDAQPASRPWAASSATSMPLASSSLALCSSYTSLIALPTRPAEVVSELAGKFAASWKPAPVAAELSVARPDEGLPPRPQATAASGLSRPYAKKQYLEDYMPYDFSVRDWRFGKAIRKHQRLPLAPAAVVASAAGSHVVAQAAPAVATPAAQAVGRFLERCELVQCSAYSALHDLAAVESSSYSLSQHALESHQRATGELLAGWAHLATPARKPLFTEPQFVVFEDANEHQTVLPVEQARKWQLLSPAGSGLAERSLAPVGKQLVSQLSNQLENTGHAMLFLSRYVERLGEPKLAARNVEAIR